MEQIKNLKVYKSCFRIGRIKNLKKYTKCLIIVDMINAFVREGVLHDEDIARIIPRLLELIEQYRKEGGLIILVRDSHSKNATEFKRFGNKGHALKGSYESELIDELKIFEGMPNVITVLKNSTSFMEAPEFRKIMKRAKNIKRVDCGGCCTDICDTNGLLGLANYFDEYNRDVEIYLHQDGVATYSEEKRQNYVDAAYLLMEQQGIQLVKKM